MKLTKETITPFLPAFPIIVEAGAHRGRDTLKMHQLWPHATIHAFEPVPALYEQLVQKTTGIAHIQTYPLALGSHTGNATLHVSSTACNAASSLLAPADYCTERPDVSFTKTTVPVTTLDDWATRYHIPKIDFLWLDLQGYEQAMLAASPCMLGTISVIHTEIALTKRYADQSLYPEYRAWLEAQGFGLMVEDLYRKTWGNALFVRS